MSIWLLLTIILGAFLIPFIIWGIRTYWNSISCVSATAFIIILIIIFIIPAIVNPFAVKREMLRQEKERQQIEYQIENLTENSDKVKLNEWILTYNDWVNDVNTSKELYGWFSWYKFADMTNRKTIPLV